MRRRPGVVCDRRMAACVYPDEKVRRPLWLQRKRRTAPARAKSTAAAGKKVGLPKPAAATKAVVARKRSLSRRSRLPQRSQHRPSQRQEACGEDSRNRRGRQAGGKAGPEACCVIKAVAAASRAPAAVRAVAARREAGRPEDHCAGCLAAPDDAEGGGREGRRRAPADDRAEEAGQPAPWLQGQRVHRLSGARRRPHRRHRGAGDRRHVARAVRDQLREGEADAARADRQAGERRHAQARRGARRQEGDGDA